METRIFEGPCTCVHPADMHGASGCCGRVLTLTPPGVSGTCPCTAHWVQPPVSAGSLPDYGRVAYEAYLGSCGGVSIRGEPLPSWDDQEETVRRHWQAAGLAVVDLVQRAMT